MRKLKYMLVLTLMVILISGCLSQKNEEKKVVEVKTSNVTQSVREPLKKMTLTQLIKLMAEKESLKKKAIKSDAVRYFRIIEDGVYLKTTTGAIHYYSYSTLIKMNSGNWSTFWDKLTTASNETTTSSYITVGEIGVPVKSYVKNGVYDEANDGLFVTTSAVTVRPNTLVKRIDYTGNIIDTISACHSLPKLFVTTESAVVDENFQAIKLDIPAGVYTTSEVIAKLPILGKCKIDANDYISVDVSLDWTGIDSNFSVTTTGAYVVTGKVSPPPSSEEFSNVNNVTATAIITVFSNQVAAPVLQSPVLFNSSLRITIPVVTGTAVKYTINGTDPNIYGTTITTEESFTITAPTEINAVAYKDGMCPSDVSYELYTNEYIVTNLNDSGIGSLRDGVGSVAKSIVFSETLAGDINLSSEIFIDKDTNITGSADKQVSLNGQNLYRIFNVSPSSTSANISIENLILKNASGSALLIGSNGGNATIINCDFINNKNIGDFGGAISAKSYFTNQLQINNSKFTSNSAIKGGAFYIDQMNPQVSLSSCTFEDNSASVEGGAMFMFYPGQVSISKSLFNKNSSLGDGGGIYVNNASISNIIIDNSTFSYNFTGSNNNGGAIYYIDNSFGSTFSLVNCTLMRNNAFSGGGIYNGMINGGAPEIKNSIVAENIAVNGKDIFGRVSANYSLVESSSDWITSTSNIYWTGISPQLNEVKSTTNKLLYFEPNYYSFVIDRGFDTTRLGGVDQIGNDCLGKVDLGAIEGPLDSTAPEVPILTVTPPATVTSSIITINGTAEPNSFITMSTSGIDIGYTTASTGGAFIISNYVALDDGDHLIDITAKDAQGNISTPASIAIKKISF